MYFRKAAVRLTAVVLSAVTLLTPALAASGTVDAGNSVLNVRSKGSTSASVITKLSSGKQVELLGKTEDNWYQISVDGVTGFVSGDYLDVASADAAALPTVQDPFYVRTTASSLNVRSGAGTDTSKVGSLSKGSVVQVLETVNGWYRTEKGYISSDYAVKCDEPTAATSADSDSSSSSLGQKIANMAKTFVGYPYVYGGSSPKGFDCSGFTSYLYRQYGIDIGRTVSAQLKNGRKVSRSEVRPGDVLIYDTHGKGASHACLYIGNGNFVHASTPKSGVKINNMNQNYYKNRLVAIVRFT